MNYTANTIEEVIAIMDHIVYGCLQNEDRLGFFASLYRTVTIIVKERCDTGFFEDNDRMRLLDVVFASRYFQALDGYRNQTCEPTQCWAASFEAAQLRKLLTLQHLLLGMNAHISLDLGIATAEVANGQITPSLERDFNRLNNILASLIDTIQNELSEISPLLRFLDRLAGRTDETFASYSINFARDRAWEFAQHLVSLSPEEREASIVDHDARVADFSRRFIMRTHWPLNFALWIVRLFESKDTRRVLEALSNETWVDNARYRVQQLIQTAEMQGVDLSKWQSAQQQIRQTAEMPRVKNL